jgi:xanthine dehydrogenase YagT iron-sulfur-binding subunit
VSRDHREQQDSERSDPKAENGEREHYVRSGGSNLTRRQFVSAVGLLSGGAAMGLPLTKGGEVMAEPHSSTRTVPLELNINGRRYKSLLDPRVTLLDLLRENLGLTGTKKGCDHGQCGACTVLAGGRRILSCLSLAASHDGEEITTIEGLSTHGALHPLQTAFLENDGFQCGYCTPGQICSAVALLKEAERGDASAATNNVARSGPVELTAEEIRERMSGNICRCGAYPGIVAAVQKVHRAEQGSRP